MWSKRPKPGGKGLRCKIALASKGVPLVFCDRPARRYGCTKNGHDLGTLDCCKNHASLCERQGVTMILIDRRKKPPLAEAAPPEDSNG